MKQKVYVSRTQLGAPGLFTAGMLAMTITDDEYTQATTPDGIAALERRCSRLGFELVGVRVFGDEVRAYR